MTELNWCTGRKPAPTPRLSTQNPHGFRWDRMATWAVRTRRLMPAAVGCLLSIQKGRYVGILSSRLKRWCITEEETGLFSFSERTLYYGRYIGVFDFILSKYFDAPPLSLVSKMGSKPGFPERKIVGYVIRKTCGCKFVLITNLMHNSFIL
jgi:hypothetical protein